MYHLAFFTLAQTTIVVLVLAKLVAAYLRGASATYGRGRTICYFSVNIRDRILGPMVLDAFCHKKLKIILKILKINF